MPLTMTLPWVPRHPRCRAPSRGPPRPTHLHSSSTTAARTPPVPHRTDDPLYQPYYRRASPAAECRGLAPPWRRLAGGAHVTLLCLVYKELDGVRAAARVVDFGGARLNQRPLVPHLHRTPHRSPTRPPLHPSRHYHTIPSCDIMTTTHRQTHQTVRR